MSHSSSSIKPNPKAVEMLHVYDSMDIFVRMDCAVICKETNISFLGLLSAIQRKAISAGDLNLSPDEFQHRYPELYI